MGIIADLCEMCRRLLLIIESQQMVLDQLNACDEALMNWKRESEHIRNELYKIDR